MNAGFRALRVRAVYYTECNTKLHKGVSLMVDASANKTPSSPETQPRDVREELDQTDISHDGPARDPGETEPGISSHAGAVEDEVTPITPPMRSPSDLVGDETEKEEQDYDIDPADEITPG
jgi:hypothetical protein